MFKDKLKQLREEKGLTQKELADKIYVSRSAICKWEMGNGIPSDVNIENICKFFNVSEEWLLDRNDMKEIVKNIHNRKMIIFSIIDIILPIIFILISIYPLYQFKCGSIGSCSFIGPQSIFSLLKYFVFIPLSIYLYTIIVAILYICKIFKKGNIILIINMIISIICFICAYFVSGYVLSTLY